MNWSEKIYWFFVLQVIVDQLLKAISGLDSVIYFIISILVALVIVLRIKSDAGLHSFTQTAQGFVVWLLVCALIGVLLGVPLAFFAGQYFGKIIVVLLWAAAAVLVWKQTGTRSKILATYK